MIHRSEVRKEILEQPCESCSEPLDADKDFVLTFCRGRFIVLHQECAAQFIQTAERRRRPKTRND